MASNHSFANSTLGIMLLPPLARGTTNTSWYNVFTAGNGANGAFFEFVIGLVASGTVDIKLTQAKDSSGTGAKDITGAVLTQITSANDNALKSIDVHPSALDDINGYKYVRAEVTVSTGTPVWGVNLWRYALRYAGVDAQDSTYDQQVEVPVV